MADERLLKYIASLSDKEREQFKNLIEEALSRDKAIKENCRRGQKNAEKFAENMGRIAEEGLKLQAGLSKLSKELLELKNRSRIISIVGIGNGPCMN
jgi:hypothetical protein